MSNVVQFKRGSDTFQQALDMLGSFEVEEDFEYEQDFDFDLPAIVPCNDNIVPDKPSREMLIAGSEAAGVSVREAYQVYRAMINAAE